MFRIRQGKQERLQTVDNFMEAFAIINNEKYIKQKNDFSVSISTAKPKSKKDTYIEFDKNDEEMNFDNFNNDTYYDFEDNYEDNCENTLRDAADRFNPSLYYDVDRVYDICDVGENYKNYIDNNY